MPLTKMTLIIFLDDFTHKYFSAANILLRCKTKILYVCKTRIKNHLSDLHFKNQIRMNEIDFLEQEIQMRENKLPRLIITNPYNLERIVKIEQFQNQFISHSEQLNKLQHVVHVNEQPLAEKAKKLNVAKIPHNNPYNYSILPEKTENYKTVNSNFKRKFFDFIIYWK